MSETWVEQTTQFGGDWTVQKLNILEYYLDAYTTALKKQPFDLVYIDTFAGSGQIGLSSQDPDASNLISGSVERAIAIDDKPFDRLIFVDKNSTSCRELENLKTCNPGRDIQIKHAEANTFLRELNMEWTSWRGVLFLDPFATQVQWSTIERIANLNALDMWFLFPISAITRLLPRSRRPDDIQSGWAECLTRVYGDESWRQLYRHSRQASLFDDIQHERDPGIEGLLAIYRTKLEVLFGERFLKMSRTLKNSTGSPLFEFFFCVGNRNGIKVATRIANHILEKI